MIRHGLGALLLGWFCCWLIQGQAQCGLHKLENVRQYGEQTITEEINFDEILRQLLNLIEVAKRNHFTTLGENIITTANKICLSGGIALELASHCKTIATTGDKRQLLIAAAVVGRQTVSVCKWEFKCIVLWSRGSGSDS